MLLVKQKNTIDPILACLHFKFSGHFQRDANFTLIKGINTTFIILK